MHRVTSHPAIAAILSNPFAWVERRNMQEYSLKDATIVLQMMPQQVKKDAGWLLRAILEVVNGLIGAKTSINYNITPVHEDDMSLHFPVYIYTIEEKSMDPIDLIHARVATLVEFLTNFQWELCEKTLLWLARAALILGIRFDFQVYTLTPELQRFDPIVQKVSMRSPEAAVVYPRIVKHVFSDGSDVRYLYDPYLMDCAIYRNMSVTFDEMGMSYNALHLYEHLVTKCWKDLPMTDVISFNGATYPIGECYIYTIHSTAASMKQYAAKLLDFMLRSRDAAFWDDPDTLADIRLETIRTISEAHGEKTLACIGRPDVKAYSFAYDTRIFRYWSNQPFDILICTSEIGYTLKHDAIERGIHAHPRDMTIVRPPDIRFTIPVYDALKYHGLTKEYILRVDAAYIRKHALAGDLRRFYGLDCMMISGLQNIGEYMSLLYPLLYNWKIYEDVAEEMLRTEYILPNRCKHFARAVNAL
jgi:hypothetical protein